MKNYFFRLIICFFYFQIFIISQAQTAKGKLNHLKQFLQLTHTKPTHKVIPIAYLKNFNNIYEPTFCLNDALFKSDNKKLSFITQDGKYEFTILKKRKGESFITFKVKGISLILGYLKYYMVTSIIYNNEKSSLYTVLSKIILLHSAINYQKAYNIIFYEIKHYYNNLITINPNSKIEIQQAKSLAIKSLKMQLNKLYNNKSKIVEINLNKSLDNLLFKQKIFNKFQIDNPNTTLVIGLKNKHLSISINTKISHSENQKSIFPIGNSDYGLIFQSNYRDTKYFDLYCDAGSILFSNHCNSLYPIYINHYRMNSFYIKNNTIFSSRYSKNSKNIELWSKELYFQTDKISKLKQLSFFVKQASNINNLIYNETEINLTDTEEEENQEKYLINHTLRKVLNTSSLFTSFQGIKNIHYPYIYFISNEKFKFKALIQYNMITGKEKTMHSSKEDIISVIFSNNQLIAVKTYFNTYKWHSYSKKFDFILEINNLFKNNIDIEILQDDINSNDILLKISFSNTFSKYYIYQKNSKKLKRINNKNNYLNYYNDNTCVTTNFNYYTKNNIQLNGVLSAPKYAFSLKPKHGYIKINDKVYVQSKMPVVILIHGAQGYSNNKVNLQKIYLANRGFVVLEPNYRSSTNQGQEVFREGLGAWRDLYEDIVHCAEWSVDNKIAKNLLISGGSFGGYLTLTCLIRRPDLFQNGIAMCPLTNISTFTKNIPDFLIFKIPDFINALNVKCKNINKFDKDKFIEENFDYLKSISPYYLIDTLQKTHNKQKILIMHGDKDNIVGVHHTEEFIDKAHDMFDIYAFIFKGESHAFNTENENSHSVLCLTEAFLKENCKYDNTHYGSSDDFEEDVKKIQSENTNVIRYQKK